MDIVRTHLLAPCGGVRTKGRYILNLYPSAHPASTMTGASQVHHNATIEDSHRKEMSRKDSERELEIVKRSALQQHWSYEQN